MTSTDNTLVNLQEEYENRQIQQVLDELEQDLVGSKALLKIESKKLLLYY